jgi:acyl-coenzyme A synthetase/AMP-(fatty) acid ligase
VDLDVTSLHHRRAVHRFKHCRASLAGYETPKSVVFAVDLPETVGGKVLKYKLRAEHAGHYRDVDP